MGRALAEPEHKEQPEGGRMFIVCPYCKIGVESSVVAHAERSGVMRAVLACPNCMEHCYAEFRGDTDRKTGKAVWHVMHPVAPPIQSPAIPENVQRDYNEATACLAIGAYRASAAMCRRALESSAIERGASKARLVDQVDELLQKSVISPQLAEWAHEIRFWGNIGVHPDEDGLADVTPDDAGEIMQFTTEYLEHVYIMPERVKASRGRRDSMKGAEP